MIQMTVTLGGLSCRVLQGGPEAMLPELVVVLCHGFGAPGEDLVPLGSELLSAGLKGRVRFIFPAAPLSLPPTYGAGRAWWPLDVERMLMGFQQGGPAALERMHAEVPEGLSEARRALLSLIEETLRQTKLPASRLVLGGFSQGAMLATDVTLRLEEAPAALCIFSGALICEADWRKRAPLRQGLKVLQSHGTLDPLLPFQTGGALRDMLTGAGLNVEFIQFRGAHTIPLQALQRMGQLIEELL